MGIFRTEKVNADYYDRLAKKELQRGNTVGARGRFAAAEWCRKTEKSAKGEKRKGC